MKRGARERCLSAASQGLQWKRPPSGIEYPDAPAKRIAADARTSPNQSRGSVRDGRASAGSRAANCWRPGNAGAAVAGVGQQILRLHAVVSAIANLRTSWPRSSAMIDAHRMGRRRLPVARSSPRTACQGCICLGRRVRTRGSELRSGAARQRSADGNLTGSTP